MGPRGGRALQSGRCRRRPGRQPDRGGFGSRPRSRSWPVRPGPSTASRWWPASSPRSWVVARRAARRPAALRRRPGRWASRPRSVSPWPRTAPSWCPTPPTTASARCPVRPEWPRRATGRPAAGFRRPTGRRRPDPGRDPGRHAGAERLQSAAAPAPEGVASATTSAPRSGYLVYWDQDEEVDYYSSTDGSQGQLMAPWDLNGQTCVLNDGSGRFIGGLGPDQSQSAQSRRATEPPVQTAGRQRGGEQRARRVHRARRSLSRALPDGPRPTGPGRARGRHRRATTGSPPTPGAPSTASTTSSPVTSGPPRARSRSPPTAAWSSGSRRPTPRPVCSTGPTPAESGRTTPTARADSPSPA